MYCAAVAGVSPVDVVVNNMAGAAVVAAEEEEVVEVLVQSSYIASNDSFDPIREVS